MNLPPSLARRLADAGFQVEHVATRGMARAIDEEILAAAKAAGEVVVTFDLDFGALLAVTGERSPATTRIRKLPVGGG
jgi:predicted nuclease of predicted toxin-antitoxin system